MNSIVQYSGVVALVILAIMGIIYLVPNEQIAGTANCAGDTTCFTKLAALTSFESDGTSSLTGNTTITGNLAVSTTTLTADFNVGATNASSTISLGRSCIRVTENKGGVFTDVYYTPSSVNTLGGWSTTTVSCF